MVFAKKWLKLIVFRSHFVHKTYCQCFTTKNSWLVIFIFQQTALPPKKRDFWEISEKLIKFGVSPVYNFKNPSVLLKKVSSITLVKINLIQAKRQNLKGIKYIDKILNFGCHKKRLKIILIVQKRIILLVRTFFWGWNISHLVDSS